MNKFTKEFISPPSDYRPLPFWSWNDKLDTEKLNWQLDELGDSGVGVILCIPAPASAQIIWAKTGCPV